MTQSERLMLRGWTRLQAQQTRGTFVLSDRSGTLGTFNCVANQPDNATRLALGGTENERAINLTVSREQFTEAEVTPTPGMTVTYQGSAYVIESIPSSHDETLVTLECVEPMRR
jgi:hypothetical protein